MDNFTAHYEKWQERVREEMKKKPERKEQFAASSEIEINRLYVPKNFDSAYMEKLGFPGEYPFTRGIRPTMYRGQLWTMRQYAGFGSAAETNQRFQYLLAEGQTGLSVAFDLPTQIGYDSDDPMALGEVGKVGVAIDSLADMELLFDEIELDQVSTSMTINAPAAVLLAMYLTVAEKQGASLERVRGTIQNDILKEYIARGTYIYPPKPSMRLITDIFSYCADEAPSFNTISISGYHIREAGSTAVQELAFTLANARAYIQSAVDAGLNVDEFAPRVAFFFNGHNNFFEEAAKFRAARRMWAKMMRDEFGAVNPKSQQLRFHTQVAGSTLTAQQPENNVVRVALQAMAAVLGGTQSLHTNAMDEALSLPTERSARIALRTQQILAYETGAADTVDPLGGSYFIESLTDELEEKAYEYLDKIEELGGAVQAVEQMYMQREIQRAAYHTQKKIESGEEIVVGVNAFQQNDEPAPDLLQIDESFVSAQHERLRELKQSRNALEVKHALKAVNEAARSNENLMYPIKEAVKVYATVGEIANELRDVFGEY
ncbi:acyl-CoA mutase large subunit family protein [Salisediminibacterium halotolerans]|uniref:acyl-CoA mutase large subunit family protein n=1 Tax=Salisediminibacterium halotolerans TaxID=517425 RepID=UPI000EAEE280|nr:methylmalonyl-CoA mutase family protein [Salisediminibacterium halotolerans]RLJ78051.1 methylmalonyl-CoA mutase N-terminal domain/subunit [Actinophytocola xinjiangensis]RPE88611.1 methylmalonyl-CoA mutase N-terminal domain/subunit [Salisediminibacterium halotolerans]TWG37028.1 methylmalonyl-CoA mutase N-terminal domain/subunit [Salisediminibacterium halotolerans]GEL08293.1 methylmalonyl-CoA mutase [Salisediminibacterium halotolerans]